MMERSCWAGVACVVIVAGCMVGPNYRRPETPAPQTWVGAEPTTRPATQPAVPTTQQSPVDAWWETLQDPVLTSLLAEAAASNLDLQIATARIRQARAQRTIAASALWPQVDASGSHTYRGASRNTGPKVSGTQGPGKQVRNAVANAALNTLLTGQTPAAAAGVAGVAQQAASSALNARLQGSGPRTSRDQNLFQAGFDATWELDIFGGTRRAIEAAEADIEAAVESRRDVLVTLLSEVALNYVELRGAQRRLAIARENIRVQQDTVDLTRTRYEAGFTNELDVAQAQAQLAATQSQVPLLESQIRQAIYQLSVLLARPPGALLSELERERPIPANPAEVPVGLPAELVRRRPDIRAAERQLASATAQIGVATADLYPRFALTGSFGPQSRTINHLFDQNSFSWAVGPGVTVPIFNAGRLRANVEVQTAVQEEALAIYERTVLTAFQDVESSLVAYVNEQVRRQSLAEAVAANQRATDLSSQLYSRGLTAFLNVLESQRALYATEDQLVQSETAVITNLISLYKALGGGWTTIESDAR